MSHDAICGIYMISCIEGSRFFYIGQSKNIINRWIGHKNLLRKHKHSNRHLQNIYNKHGAKSFIFSVILECDVTDLDMYEQKMLDLYNGYYRNINICKEVKTTRGVKASDETKKLFSIQRTGDKNPMYGKPRTEDVKERLRLANTGKKHTKETRKKMSLSRVGKPGHPVSEEHKEKLRIKKSTSYKFISPEGKIFEGVNVKEFARVHNLTYPCMARLGNGSNKTHKGWKRVI